MSPSYYHSLNLILGIVLQRIPYTQALSGVWTGSENIYSAALLSSVKDFKGEATSYLRVAHRWLRIHFEERKKEVESNFPGQDTLKRTEILEFIWTHYNLSGAASAVTYLLGWTPPDVIFEVAGLLVRRLIDAGDYGDLDAMAQAGMHNPYFMIALADELSAAPYLLPRAALACALEKLLAAKASIPKTAPAYGKRSYVYAIVSFTEACAVRGLPRAKILTLLHRYTWLMPSPNMAEAFGGLVWSALGSPHSVIRWQAAHCVRRLAAHGCHEQLEALISWMQAGSVGAFGGVGFNSLAL